MAVVGMCDLSAAAAAVAASHRCTNICIHIAAESYEIIRCHNLEADGFGTGLKTVMCDVGAGGRRYKARNE